MACFYHQVDGFQFVSPKALILQLCDARQFGSVSPPPRKRFRAVIVRLQRSRSLIFSVLGFRGDFKKPLDRRSISALRETGEMQFDIHFRVTDGQPAEAAVRSEFDLGTDAEAETKGDGFANRFSVVDLHFGRDIDADLSCGGIEGLPGC